MKNMDIIGVVILNYKSYRDTIRLTNDLLKFSTAENLRIVIVDNRSPNESYDVLSKEFQDKVNVSVIQSDENGGYAKGNNIGMRFLDKFSPKYVLVVNNDVYFDEAILEKCIENYKQLNSPGAIAPLQLLPNGQEAYLGGTFKCSTFFEDLMSYFILYGKLKKIIHKTHKSNYDRSFREVEIVPGAFIFMSYRVAKEINFFSEDTFLYGEERFLYKKLLEKDKKNYLLLDCSYIHDHSTTINSEYALKNQLKLLHNSKIAYTMRYRKHPKLKSQILRFAFTITSLERKIYSLYKKKHQ